MSVLIILISLAYIFLILFLLYGFTRVDDFFGKNTSPKTHFSIIIPFRNEAENLPRLFTSLRKLDYPYGFYEILLVNDASQDASEELCSQFINANSQLNVRLLQNNRITGSPKKNAITTALGAATKEYMITTDADCTVPEAWLKEFNARITTSDARMIAGPVRISVHKRKSGFLDLFQELDFFSLQGATIGGFGIDLPFMCNGANFCYEKKAFQKVNGFEGNENIASGDDIFLLEKFKKEGFKIAFLKSKNAIVKTQPQPDWKSFFAQRIRWAAKTSAYNNFFGKLTGLLILTMNLMLAVIFLGVLTGKITSSLLLVPFLLKFNIDFILIYHSARFFEREKVLKNYFWCSFIYPFLTSYIAVLSLFSGYNWKGRRFKK